MTNKCYQCQFRKDLEYSAHSQCVHPAIGGEQNLIGFLAYAKGYNPLHIEGNPHGIKKGWFTWPINFDPVWLENCTGFKQINNPTITEENETTKII